MRQGTAAPLQLVPIPQPAHNLQLFDGEAQLVAFGRQTETVEDWSLGLLKNPGDGAGSGLKDCSVTRHLHRIAADLGFIEAYAPSPIEFNAKICCPENFKDFGVEIEITSSRGWPMMLFRGVRVDGILLNPGMTFMISAAGCPLILLWHKRTGKLGIAHAGMRCLVDEGRLKGNPDSNRPYDSVVQTLAHAAGCANNERSAEAEMIIFGSIAPDKLTYSWEHPEFGELNKKRSIHFKKLGRQCTPNFEDGQGCLNLAEIIRAQALLLGMKEENIKEISPSPKLYDTRDPKPEGSYRNLYIVRRRKRR